MTDHDELFERVAAHEASLIDKPLLVVVDVTVDDLPAYTSIFGPFDDLASAQVVAVLFAEVHHTQTALGNNTLGMTLTTRIIPLEPSPCQPEPSN